MTWTVGIIIGASAYIIILFFIFALMKVGADADKGWRDEDEN